MRLAYNVDINPCIQLDISTRNRRIEITLTKITLAERLSAERVRHRMSISNIINA